MGTDAQIDRRSRFSDAIAKVITAKRQPGVFVFAATAVLLAAIGSYGVLAFLVRQRTHELGIRIALGAPRSRLLMFVLGGALRLTIAGVAVGLLGAYALTRLSS